MTSSRALLASAHRRGGCPLYGESLDDVVRWLEGPVEERDLVHTPTGCSVFAYELQGRPRKRRNDGSPTSAIGTSLSVAALCRLGAA